MAEKQGSLAANLKGMEERTIVTVARASSATLTPRETLKRITMIVEPEFHQRLKMHSVKTRITMEDIYRQALNEFCERHNVE